MLFKLALGKRERGREDRENINYGIIRASEEEVVHLEDILRLV
jgi:hypothetical protein